MMKLRSLHEILSAVWACLSSNLHPFFDANFTHPFLALLTFHWIQNNVLAKTYKLIVYILFLVF